MSKILTIVMYHYVRPVNASPYPGLKGLELDSFLRQLDYLTAWGRIISPDELQEPDRWPPNPVLLTFDDGFIDHYLHVFPILRQRKILGVFSPVVSACRDQKMLDVHKLQFILACVRDPGLIVDHIDYVIQAHQETLGFTGPGYRATMAKRRLDTPEVSFIKNMLQRDLPPAWRRPIVDLFFAEHVSADEDDFAASLYLNENQLKEMCAEGMNLAIHGVSHRWLNRLSAAEQEEEITESIAFLTALGQRRRTMGMTYPYGGFNQTTIDILKDQGVCWGVTSRSARADLARDEWLKLPRLDTNDLTSKA